MPRPLQKIEALHLIKYLTGKIAEDGKNKSNEKKKCDQSFTKAEKNFGGPWFKKDWSDG